MPPTIETDFLIVGQGLAGTLLAFELMQAGYSVYIIDNSHFEASSKVAAGLINPITGRRLVKSEQIDELLPVAKETYRKLQDYLGISIWKDRKINWALNGIKEENDWNVRVSQDGYLNYMSTSTTDHSLMVKINGVDAFGIINSAAQVNISLLIEVFAQKINAEGNLLRAVFDYDLLDNSEKDFVRYGNIKAGKIIFCEGEKGRFNPFFKASPFYVAKGEVLIIRAPELNTNDILKSHITFCPLGDDLYWVGSNYEWNAGDANPTSAFRESFECEIRNFLRIPFEVLEHKAAIRPTVKNRTPIIGFHPEFPNIGIFNGLGTKGTSLGPWWAKQLVQLTINN